MTCKPSGIYQDKFACFRCRKVFKKDLNREYYQNIRKLTGSNIKNKWGKMKRFMSENKRIETTSCPGCGGKMTIVSTGFEAPKKNDVKAWKDAEKICRSGEPYKR
ncbi:hypothetical protein ACFL3V_01325 [Nanoarchaeota archaeon]